MIVAISYGLVEYKGRTWLWPSPMVWSSTKVEHDCGHLLWFGWVQRRDVNNFVCREMKLAVLGTKRREHLNMATTHLIWHGWCGYREGCGSLPNETFVPPDRGDERLASYQNISDATSFILNVAVNHHQHLFPPSCCVNVWISRLQAARSCASSPDNAWSWCCLSTSATRYTLDLSRWMV